MVRRIDAAAESARSVLSAFARPGCDRPAGVDWQPRTLTTHQHLSRALEPPTGIDGSPRTAKPLGVRLIRLQRGLPHAGTDRHASMLVLGMPANTAHPRAARVRSSLPTSHVVGGGAQKAFWTARDGFNRPLGDDGGLGSCADIVRREPMASRSLWNLLREPTGLPTLPPHLSRHPGARPRPRGRRASSRRARLLFISSPRETTRPRPLQSHRSSRRLMASPLTISKGDANSSQKRSGGKRSDRMRHDAWTGSMQGMRRIRHPGGLGLCDRPFGSNVLRVLEPFKRTQHG